MHDTNLTRSVCIHSLCWGDGVQTATPSSSAGGVFELIRQHWTCLDSRDSRSQYQGDKLETPTLRAGCACLLQCEAGRRPFKQPGAPPCMPCKTMHHREVKLELRHVGETWKSIWVKRCQVLQQRIAFGLNKLAEEEQSELSCLERTLRSCWLEFRPWEGWRITRDIARRKSLSGSWSLLNLRICPLTAQLKVCLGVDWCASYASMMSYCDLMFLVGWCGSSYCQPWCPSFWHTSMAVPRQTC